MYLKEIESTFPFYTWRNQGLLVNKVYLLPRQTIKVGRGLLSRVSWAITAQARDEYQTLYPNPNPDFEGTL